MTATDELRQHLDERGVEWGRLVDSYGIIGTFWWDSNNDQCSALEGADDIPIGKLSVQANLTPEQAVEATLGPAVPPPEPPVVPYDLLIDELRDTWGIEACWDGLRKFWYLGWTDEYVEDMGRLHDELRDSIVELLGGRCDWVQTGVMHAHMVLDRAASMGRGTCKVVSKPCDMWECECGKAWWHGGAPNYCPSCGKKVEQ